MLISEITNLINLATLSTPARASSPDLDKLGFLRLLVKQLSMQDPLDPMTNEEFVGQLALFGSLEQQMNLNESFAQFMGFQKLTQASTLLGKTVISVTRGEDGFLHPVTGVVEQVVMLNGLAYLKLSTGDEVPLESVVSVEPGGDK